MVTVPDNDGTVTVAVADFVVSIVEAALTVSVAAVSFADTVKVPLVAMLVPDTPPVTVHVTVCAGLLVPVTVAVNACVAPLSTVAVGGFTVTLVTVGDGACAAVIGPTVLLPVILPSYPVLVTVTVIYLPTSSVTNVYVDEFAPEMLVPAADDVSPPLITDCSASAKTSGTRAQCLSYLRCSGNAYRTG